MTMKVGDIVYLVSGGPSMTVNKVDGENVVTQWFVGVGYQSMTFPMAALTVTDPIPQLEFSRQNATDALRPKPVSGVIAPAA